MLTLESLSSGQSLTGVEPSQVVTVAAIIPIAEGVVQLLYKTPDGTTKERLLNREDEAGLALATVERPWSFANQALLARSSNAGCHKKP